MTRRSPINEGSRASDLLFSTRLYGRTPAERAVIRVLLLAEQHPIDVPTLLDRLSQDISGSLSGQISALSRSLAAGEPIEDAVARYPSLIGAENAIAIRMGCEAGDVSSVFREILATDEFSGETWVHKSLGTNSFSFAGRILTYLVLIQALVLFVLPTFEQLFAEFELSLPAPTLLLLHIANNNAGIIPAVFLIFTIGSLCVAFARIPEWLHAFSQRGFDLLAWRKVVLPWPTRLLLLLGVAERLVGIRRGFQILAHQHPHARVRALCSQLEAAVDAGLDPYDALAKARVLRAGDAKLIAGTTTPDTREWFLDWIVHRTQRGRYARVGLFQRVLSAVLFSMGAVLVGFSAFAIFMPLISLIQAMT